MQLLTRTEKKCCKDLEYQKGRPLGPRLHWGGRSGLFVIVRCHDVGEELRTILAEVFISQVGLMLVRVSTLSHP